MTAKVIKDYKAPRLETDIAIVGIGCRFPGAADSPEAFWKLLIDGVDAVSAMPAERWNFDSIFDPRPGIPGRSYSRWGGLVDGIDQFDAEFFGLSRREAERMDPQQRMLLEASWEALEDAGISLTAQAGETGVFVGISTNDYALMQAGIGDLESIDIFTPTGGAFSIAANRISHLLDLGGPSLAIDTACSSALTAVHLACRALRSGDCRVALAGGVNALLLPSNFVGFSRMSMLSPDGRCKAFDAGANGFVRGEGVGIIALEPLSAALAAGRPIYALIRGTAANQDGHTSSLTVPAAEAQRALILAACQDAGIDDRSTIDYVEAHGTGTQVGDPIEASALAAAFAQLRPPGHPLLIGSVKTNIGHLEAGAGAAGIIKAALTLSQALIPPSLHFKEPSAHIDFEGFNLQVVCCPTPLPSAPARVAVNSFGFGGSNAHVIMESAPAFAGQPAKMRDPGVLLLPLPLRTHKRTAAVARHWLNHIGPGGAGEQVALADLCHAAATRRNQRGLRGVVLADNREELLQRLAALAAEESEVEGVLIGQPTQAVPAPVFVYAGQGTQWWAMGRELRGREPVFDQVIDACDRLFSTWGNWSLSEELARDEATSLMHHTAIAQPAIFAVQVALTRLWASWGVHPAACVGHSVGEVAAAWAAGVLSFEDAARVIFHRGRCMEEASQQGRMLAVGLSPQAAEALIAPYAGRVSLAAVNSPSLLTLAGDADPLQQIAARLSEAGTFHRFLQVQYPFHTASMDPVRQPLLQALGSVPTHPARVPLISTVTAELATEEDYGTDYWWRNVREPVLFGPAVERLAAIGHQCFIEIGAHPALAGPISESAHAAGVQALVLASLRRGAAERLSLLQTLAALYVRGYPVNWDGVLGGPRQAVPLPREPWQRERYWQESEATQFERTAALVHPLVDRRLDAAEPNWQARIDLRRLPWLEDHCLQGRPIFPAAGYVDMILAAAQTVSASASGLILDEVDFRRMLTLSNAEEGVRMELRHRPSDGIFEVWSREGRADWALNATASLRQPEAGRRPDKLPFTAIQARLNEKIDPEQLGQRFAESGLYYGPAFRGISAIHRRDGEALARIRVPESIAKDLNRCLAHPAILDACFQVLGAALPHDIKVSRTGPYLPIQVGKLWLHAPLHGPLWTHVILRRCSGRNIEGDILIADMAGDVLVTIERFCCQAITYSRDSADAQGSEGGLYRQRWKPSSRAETMSAAQALAPIRVAVAAAQAIEGRDSAPEGRWTRHLKGISKHNSDITDWVIAAFRKLGWRFRRAETISIDALASTLGIIPEQRKLFHRFLCFLEEDGYIARQAEKISVLAAPPRRDPVRTWRQLMHAAPGMLPELTLIGTCGERLADILSGAVDPLTVLFPDGWSTPLEHFYQAGYSMVSYNTMIAEAVAAAIAPIPAGRAIRVLEIGAGTGGMSAHVLPRLPKESTHYIYTDISNAFFSRVEKKLYDYRFIEFATLDIEEEPQGQGFDLGSFDIILASDVFHAVRDLGDALNNARRLLAPGGMLAFIDVSQPPRWVDMVFGLTSGWWRFDDDIRKDHPSIDRQSWLTAIAGSGFIDAEAVEMSQSDIGGQLVMLARRPLSDQASLGALIDERQSVETATNLRPWLIFSDRGGLGSALLECLAQRGRPALLAPNSNDCEAVSKLLASLDSEGASPERVVYLEALDAPSVLDCDATQLAAGEVTGVLGLLHLSQRLTTTDRAPLQLVVATRGAQRLATPSEPAINPAVAPVWGLARVVANEYRHLDSILIDLDPSCPTDKMAEAEALIAQIESPDEDREIALRAGSCYVNRIQQLRFDELASVAEEDEADRRYRLEIPAPGVLDRLTFMDRSRIAPGPGEVEIEIHAAALNFRDVMKAMGIYPTANIEDELPGDECAGIVTRLGVGVTHLQQGQEVLALGQGCFASHVTLPATLVFAKPLRLSFEEAVTIPVPFLTAWHCLHSIAQIRRGETLLIHTATGGVGLAALQVARAVGAKVLASAGAPEKRAFLRALGVDQVLHSRSLDFLDDVRAATQGRGVDIILNALSGRAIETGLSALASGGRFLEIGKRDIYQNTRIGLRPFRNCITFSSIDLQQVMSDQPQVAAKAMRSVIRRVEEGRFSALPYRVFPIDRADDAFRHFSQARHIGKIVLSSLDAQVRARPTRTVRAATLQAEASYMVCGGLGGFGLVLADWLVRSGARHLLLVGRSGASRPEAVEALERWRREGIQVWVESADIADPQAVTRLFTLAATEMPVLKGVFHSAMVLDDAIVAHLTPQRLEAVMAPKVAGAWNLHQQSLHVQLEHFVVFSSVSQLVGNTGQANYVAANSFLVALAQYRHSLGLPALAVDWGPITQAGHLARHAEISERLEQMGLLGIPAGTAVEALGRLMGADVADIAFLRMDWQAWSRSHQGRLSTRYADLTMLTETDSERQGGGLRERLLSAPVSERETLVLALLREQIAAVLRIAASDIDITQPLTDQGLDSLMAIDLVMRLDAAFEISVPTSRISAGLNVRDLAGVVLSLVTGEGMGGMEKTAAQALPTLATAPMSCLIPLRAQGEDTPLFLLHPAGGRVLTYQNLVEALPSTTPVFGIESRGLDGQQEEFDTLEEMAGAYADLIERQQPEGALRIGGFSMGGFTALAVVADLEARGREVISVALIDSDPRWLDRSIPPSESARLVIQDLLAWVEEQGLVDWTDDVTGRQAVEELVEEMLTLDADGRIERLSALVAASGRLKGEATQSAAKQFMSLNLHHIGLLEAGMAVPLQMSAKALLFASRNSSPHASDWSRIIPTTLILESFDCSHFDMLRPPICQRIAAQLVAQDAPTL